MHFIHLAGLCCEALMPSHAVAWQECTKRTGHFSSQPHAPPWLTPTRMPTSGCAALKSLTHCFMASTSSLMWSRAAFTWLSVERVSQPSSPTCNAKDNTGNVKALYLDVHYKRAEQYFRPRTNGGVRHPLPERHAAVRVCGTRYALGPVAPPSPPLRRPPP